MKFQKKSLSGDWFWELGDLLLSQQGVFCHFLHQGGLSILAYKVSIKQPGLKFSEIFI